MNILIVDDEAFMLELLERQLVALGLVDVMPYERAQDALAAIENDRNAVDLVFCDLQMPEMDGVEFVRHLARLDYDGGLVLLSGEDDRILQTVQKLALAHRLNLLAALHKPVAPGQLKQILAGNHIRPPSRPDSTRKTYPADELRRAIAAGELINYYQPKVELASGAVGGVETLVRWSHPGDGLVYPDQFIATAEANGLIDQLTRVVLAAALRQMRCWHDSGLLLQVAVNVSMDNLESLEFPDCVALAASAAGVPPSELVLEVTESKLTKDPLASLEILTRLRLKRIGLSIDDFGTGHSSLAQLRDIPFGELKVDRGFVHGACDNGALRAIVEASLGMARQLGMKTVAEGVEDRDDWDFLRTSGCDLAQGYFIAKPMPGEELVAWIDSWRARYRELGVAAS